MKQSELIKQLSNEDLRKSVIYSQLLFIVIAALLSLVLFEDLRTWTFIIQFDISEVVYFGILPGILIVLVDLVLMRFLPSKHYDDGGINKRIFSDISIDKILLLTFLIALSEELLFRGVIQTNFGYIFASVSFAIVHVRYLRKPVLLISILFVSFLIGYMYEVTDNLLVTIFSHFIVDFLLGIFIRYKSWGES
jgi:uncharacterized protein